MARGHEIERLKAEIESLRGENGGENRRIQHELALLRAENGKLNVQVEQANEAHDSAMEENRHLRQEIQNLKTTLQKHEKNREDVRYARAVLIPFFLGCQMSFVARY